MYPEDSISGPPSATERDIDAQYPEERLCVTQAATCERGFLGRCPSMSHRRRVQGRRAEARGGPVQERSAMISSRKRRRPGLDDPLDCKSPLGLIGAAGDMTQ